MKFSMASISPVFAVKIPFLSPLTRGAGITLWEQFMSMENVLYRKS
jgi:hypothetical protein